MWRVLLVTLTLLLLTSTAQAGRTRPPNYRLYDCPDVEAVLQVRITKLNGTKFTRLDVTPMCYTESDIEILETRCVDPNGIKPPSDWVVHYFVTKVNCE